MAVTKFRPPRYQPDQGPKGPDYTALFKRIEQDIQAHSTAINTLEESGGGGGVGLSSATPQPVGSAGSPGSGTLANPDDHVHAGVSSIETTGGSPLTGAVEFAADPGATVRQDGQTVFIGANGGEGGTTCPLLPVTFTNAASFDLGPCCCILLVDATLASVTVNLPDATTQVNGTNFTVKKVAGTFPVILTPVTGQLIDGFATFSINTVMESISVVTDTANYWIY